MQGENMDAFLDDHNLYSPNRVHGWNPKYTADAARKT